MSDTPDINLLVDKAWKELANDRNADMRQYEEALVFIAGKNISFLRHYLGFLARFIPFTQKEFADLLAVSVATLQRWELQQRLPRPNHQNRIIAYANSVLAPAFHVHRGHLLCRNLAEHFNEVALSGKIGPKMQVNKNSATDAAPLALDIDLATAVETCADMLMILSPDGIRRYVSSSVSSMLGYDREHLMGKYFLDIVHPDDREQAKTLMSYLLSDNNLQSSTIELRMQHANGTWVTVEYIFSNKLSDDRIRGVVASARDVTERSQLKEELFQKSSRLQRVLQSLPDPYLLIDMQGRILDHSYSTTDSWLKNQTFIGRKVSDIFPNPANTTLQNTILKVIATSQTTSVEYSLLVEGKELFYEARIIPFTRNQVICVARDITERIESDRLLQQNKLQLSGILDSAMDAIVTVDDEFKIVLFNKYAEELFGCTNPLGRSLSDFIPTPFRSSHDGHMKTFAATGVTNRRMATARPVMALRADGSSFAVEASISQFMLGNRRFFTAILREKSTAAKEVLEVNHG